MHIATLSFDSSESVQLAFELFDLSLKHYLSGTQYSLSQVDGEPSHPIHNPDWQDQAWGIFELEVAGNNEIVDFIALASEDLDQLLRHGVSADGGVKESAISTDADLDG